MHSFTLTHLFRYYLRKDVKRIEVSVKAKSQDPSKKVRKLVASAVCASSEGYACLWYRCKKAKKVDG